MDRLARAGELGVNPGTGQVGVLAAGGVLVGLPVYRSIKDSGSLPSARRVTVPLVVIGGCALLASVSPILGVGIAWLAVLALALQSQATAKPTQRPLTGPLSSAPHVPGGALPRTPHH